VEEGGVSRVRVKGNGRRVSKEGSSSGRSTTREEGEQECEEGVSESE